LQQLDLGVSLFRTHPLLNNSLRHYGKARRKTPRGAQLANASFGGAVCVRVPNYGREACGQSSSDKHIQDILTSEW
jgi:hypothetical protein